MEKTYTSSYDDIANESSESAEYSFSDKGKHFEIKVSEWSDELKAGEDYYFKVSELETKEAEDPKSSYGKTLTWNEKVLFEVSSYELSHEKNKCAEVEGWLDTAIEMLKEYVPEITLKDIVDRYVNNNK